VRRGAGRAAARRAALRAGLAPVLAAWVAACGEARQADAPKAIDVWLFDATDGSGLDFVHERGGKGNRELAETMGGGVALIDYDQDGDWDAHFSQSGPVRAAGAPDAPDAARDALYANDGRGRFARVPGAAGADDPGYGQGLAVGDVDGDGRDDLYSLNWGANRMYLNRGARFEDRTEECGTGDGDRWSVSAAFFDADGDGDLDLYVVNYLKCAPGSYLDPAHNPRAPAGFGAYPHPDRFAAEDSAYYENLGDGRFEDQSAAAGFAIVPQKGLGVVPTDIELDGWVDLYQANDSTPNFLFHNRGDGTFEEIGARSGTAFNDAGRTEAGMGVDSADADGDGDLDLFVTNLDMETNTLYLNRLFEVDAASGAPRSTPLCYRDRTALAGLAEPSRAMVGFGTQFADLDRDGDPDLLVINGHIIDNVEEISDSRRYRQPAQAFANDGRGRFGVVPPSKTPGLERPIVGRGLASADLDGDGDLDFLVGCNGEGPRLLRGALESSGLPSLELALAGPAGNPRGLGATLFLESEDGTLRLARIDSARGYASASAPVLVIGVPSALRAVEVLWPGGRRERFDDLPRPFLGRQMLRWGGGR
jgi:hypothetical protein